MRTGRVGATLLPALLLASCGGLPAPVELSPVPTSPPTSPATGGPSTAPPTTPTSDPTPIPAASTDAMGMQRSGLTASGDFLANTIDQAPTLEQPDPFRYIVLVETSVPLPPDEVAAQVHAVLNDARGWTGTGGAGFALVAGDPKPDFTINLATPPTVDKACGDLGTMGVWSCRMGDTVWFNVDRWLYATPVWAEEPIGEYRAYMINHEVGHFLGFGHVGCPAQGAPSPVMQQQSINLNGCLPNAWPQISGEQGR